MSVVFFARVSLSDCLAFQARIRGFENPRLLRDRPSDGAAVVRENFMRIVWGVQVVAEGHAGQSFRLFALAGKDPGV